MTFVFVSREQIKYPKNIFQFHFQDELPLDYEDANGSYNFHYN